MIAAMSLNPHQRRPATLFFVLATALSVVVFCLLLAHLGQPVRDDANESDPGSRGSSAEAAVGSRP
jgi:hypothetical protein